MNMDSVLKWFLMGCTGIFFLKMFHFRTLCQISEKKVKFTKFFLSKYSKLMIIAKAFGTSKLYYCCMTFENKLMQHNHLKLCCYMCYGSKDNLLLHSTIRERIHVMMQVLTWRLCLCWLLWQFSHANIVDDVIIIRLMPSPPGEASKLKSENNMMQKRVTLDP